MPITGIIHVVVIIVIIVIIIIIIRCAEISICVKFILEI